MFKKDGTPNPLRLKSKTQRLIGSVNLKESLKCFIEGKPFKMPVPPKR